jgi:hypothetical protein
MKAGQAPVSKAKRHLLARVCWFAAIGVMLSVLVAWICAFAHFDLAADGERALQPDPRATVTWAGVQPSRPGRAPYTQKLDEKRTRTGLIARSEGYLGRDGNAVFEHYREWTLTTGWPEPCMRVRVVEHMLMTVANPPTATLTRWQNGSLVPSLLRTGDHWPLPLRPVGGAFAASTVFWACIVFGLWTAPRFLRRSFRRRRRCCVRCGYRMLGMSVCPECGLTVS